MSAESLTMVVQVMVQKLMFNSRHIHLDNDFTSISGTC